MAAAAEFDAAAACRSIEAVRPGLAVFEVSVKTGEGMERWLELLQSRRYRGAGPAKPQQDAQRLALRCSQGFLSP